MLALPLSYTHTHIYHKAMTEPNSWGARPVSLTGLEKTALHREVEREKDGVREAKKDGLEGRDWTEMDCIPEKKVLKKEDWLFVCSTVEGIRVKKVKQRCD